MNRRTNEVKQVGPFPTCGDLRPKQKFRNFWKSKLIIKDTRAYGGGHKKEGNACSINDCFPTAYGREKRAQNLKTKSKCGKRDKGNDQGQNIEKCAKEKVSKKKDA